MTSAFVRLAALAVGTLGLAACTFVPVTSEGEQVHVATPAEVRNCTELGTTTVSIRDRVGFIRRPPESLHKEVEATARNVAAADWNANVIVPRTHLQDGRQVFDVYRC